MNQRDTKQPLKFVEAQERFLANIQAEEDTLACLLQSPIAIQRVIDTLEPDHFYRDAHRTIYQAMVYLYQHDRRCNVVNVRDELQRRGKLEEVENSKVNLYVLANNAAHFERGGVEDPARAVIEKATFRRLREGAQEIFTLANREEDGAIDQAIEIISKVALGTRKEAITPFSDVVEDALDQLRQRRIDAANMIGRGLSTGYPDLDRMYGGLQPGHLITVGALTGYGKSAWALNMVLNIALSQDQKHVYFASLEMSRAEILERALSVRAEVDHGLIRDGTLSDDEMERVEVAAESLADCQIWLDDDSYSVSAICRQAKHRNMQHKLDLIVVDYLQLLENTSHDKKGSTRAQEVEEISRQLKKLAHELDVPVVALVQINRNVRDGEEPELRDINESGGIARNSNEVIFIYAEESQLERREKSLPFEMTLKVAKARSGRQGKINVVFAPRITKFANLSLENLYAENEE